MSGGEIPDSVARIQNHEADRSRMITSKGN